MLFTERIEDDVDLVEHIHNLHGRDVDADLIELHDVAEQDGHIWEDLEKTHAVKTRKVPKIRNK